jgi:hypothetical protein
MKTIFDLKLKVFWLQFFLILFTLVPFTSKGQYWMSKYGYLDNYYLIRDSTDAFFNNDTSRINDKNFGFKQFQRWKTFMEPRVNETGDLTAYHQAYTQEYDKILADNDHIPGQWNPLGPLTGTTIQGKAELGIVTSMWIDPTDHNKMYLGSGTGGLFATVDGGLNWTCKTDKYLINGIEAIVKNNGTIYIGTGFFTWGREYSQGILKSTDDGLTWTKTGLTANSFGPYTVRGIVEDPNPDPAHPETYFAIINFENLKRTKILRTIDGWTNFETVYDTAANVDLQKIEFDPLNPDRLIASGKTLVISNNNGVSWTELTPNIQLPIGARILRVTESFHPSIANKLVLMMKYTLKDPITNVENASLHLYISNNAGNSFVEILPDTEDDDLTDLAFTEYMFELEWSKAHEDIFFVGGMGVGKLALTANSTYKCIQTAGADYHVDCRFLQTFKKLAYSNFVDEVYQGNDGGVTKGIEESGSALWWYDISGKGLNITQYYGLAILESDPNFYLGGTQDGNLFIHDGDSWYNRGNIGDAAEAVIDYNNPDNIYMVRFCSGTNGGYLSESLDGGHYWLPFHTGMPGEGQDRRNDAPLEMSPTDPSMMFIGSKNIYKSSRENGNLVFKPISDFDYPIDPKTQLEHVLPHFKSIRVCPTNNNYIVAGRGNAYWDQDLEREKLLYTPNGGGSDGKSWYNISPVDGSEFDLHDVGIMDIAFDLNYHDIYKQFFIALDRFNPNKKVFKVTVAGSQATYTNMSEGLPNLPVNCIEVYKDSEIEEMFAGTDCGVYYYNNQMKHWIKYGTGMPVCPVSDIEINYTTKQILVSTFGRGMYYAELCEIGPSELDIYITGTEVWEENKRVPANIIIQPKGNLTIKGEVFMKYNKSIIVHKGAFLTVDGGKITSQCTSQPWAGIRILGTSLGGQNPLYQGLVFLKNEALIENAIIGIHCYNAPDNSDANICTGGGIIMANNSKFRNNITSVVFEPYSYTTSSSYFKNCNFITENFSSETPLKYFVRINEVSGGSFFKNCIFNNEISTSRTEKGIYSYDSHFVVDSSDFKNLVYGIYATSKPGTRNFKVTNSILTNNDCGIYALSFDNIDIRDNDFNMPKEGERRTGLYLDRCTGYIIEENDFMCAIESGSTTPENRGIYVYESGPNDNILYLNTFDNLDYGIVAEGINKSRDGFYGLQIKCNTFTHTKNDISVLPEVLSNTIGIATNQGQAFPKLCDQLANNIFSQYAGNIYHFYNGPSARVYYHYLGSNSLMQPRHIVRVETRGEFPTFGGECCSPNVYGGGGTAVVDQSNMEYKNNALLADSELDSLIDQGATDEKLFTLNTAIPDEALLITNDLLEVSPYISDTVIKKSIAREDVINNSMLRDVMVANPNTAKSSEIMDQLNNRINPMPDYMINEILVGISIESAREQKEAEVNLNRRAFAYGINRQLAELLSDTLISKNDSINKLMTVVGDYNSLLKKSWSLMEQGDTVSALNLISSLDSLDLTSEKKLDLLSQVEFMNWMIENPVFDTSQIESLVQFSSSPSVKVSSSAISKLLANDIIVYNEPYSVIDYTKISDPIKTIENKPTESVLVVNPNPAKEYITIIYESSTLSPTISIYDSEGRLIFTKSLFKQRDEIVISTHDFKDGMYLLRLNSGNGIIESVKFIISK